ncbi:MAG: protein kinase domain-containing protein [Candidatus Acidiferrales bacterium]
MSLVGKTISHYRVVGQLGAGGMGEVYRAQDTRLGREVAIKVLPDAFTYDPERLARFEREAHLLASLNHPHIAVIHGLEEADGRRCLVLELVEGETLAERLTRGAAPLEEALMTARQIAEALEAAHEKGIVHRDLKPGNVKVTPEGAVKVLDFGLAKAFESEGVEEDISKTPTLTSPATRIGVLLGTAAYMSPEQARGKIVDKRADIWAFGCVLFEMLTGKQLFGGDTITDTLAAVVRAEPDWTTLPVSTPPKVQQLLRRCLQKDPRQRLRDIGEARIAVEEVLAGKAEAPEAAPVVVAARGWPERLPWLVAGVLAVLLAVSLGGLWRTTRTVLAPPTRLAVPITPPDALFPGDQGLLAISPDGRRLVYVASRQSTAQLYLRSLDQFQATPMPGTEGATTPFFSPDGEWVGFFAGGKLKKVSIRGGAPTTLCDGAANRGATWSPDDMIYFTPSPVAGLYRVPAAGGTPQGVTKPDSSKGERSHRWPQMLPGGKAILFTFETSFASFNDAHIGVYSPETGQRRTVFDGGANAHYAASGHLVFGRIGSLLAVPFNLTRLEVTGPPAPVVEGVMMNPSTGAVHFDLSADGSLLYLPGSARAVEHPLFWVDRKGVARPAMEGRRAFIGPRLSPDGSRLAVEIGGPTTDIWVYDLARQTLTRLTFEGSNFVPFWTPDGKRIVFSSDRAGVPNLFWKAADGSAPEERLTTSGSPQFASSVSPDGQRVLFRESTSSTASDVMVLPLEGERKPQPFVQTSFEERYARFSADGGWVAYMSNESGQPEVYVQPYPGPGGKWQISTEGGTEPVWSRDGRELFYRNGNKLMAVSVQTRSGFQASTPRMLFEGPYELGTARATNYDVAPDGQRFVMIKLDEQATGSSQLNVVLHWFDELGRLASPEKK